MSAGSKTFHTVQLLEKYFCPATASAFDAELGLIHERSHSDCPAYSSITLIVVSVSA